MGWKIKFGGQREEGRHFRGGWGVAIVLRRDLAHTGEAPGGMLLAQRTDIDPRRVIDLGRDDEAARRGGCPPFNPRKVLAA